MTATVPDLDQLADLDFKPACELKFCQAGHPDAAYHYQVEWMCGHRLDLLACTHCHDRKVREFSVPPDHVGVVACDRCTLMTLTVLLRWRFEPLS